MTIRTLDNEAIFHAARDIPDGDHRRVYVREACGGDEARIAHVVALLSAAEAPDSLLDRPAGSDPVATIDQPAAESAGTVIGPYKLIEQVGEGGMGAVWMAQQTQPVKRMVALKLIKPGIISKQIVARFEAECQALALMDHANIAHVLDAGTTSAGRPYLVMDLVKGVPITRHCDEQRLTPRQRLELFIPVCLAVQHAHQKGIVHRDLKPSNVLVAPYDGKPVPKVIDFGVAKAAGQSLTEKTLVTGFGAIVGTLEYMSPEQAELNNRDIDTRSDIYSLGVLLYELLAGAPPFTRTESEAGGVLEMLRLIREQEPTKPSAKLTTAEGLPALAANRGTEPAKLTKLVRGDLDWIVMKALEKDRGRRYDTAHGFAQDVQRYLADEPVQARPPSAAYRLRKFARRNRGPVVATSVILLCLLTGIVGTTAGLVWAVRERDKKAGALIAKTRALESEKQARDRAMIALRDMTDEFVENQMARDAQLTDENKLFLRKIIEDYEGFAAVTGDDAESRAIRAEGYFRVGTMRYHLGEFKEAEAAYGEALALFKQLANEFPAQPEYRRDLAKSHNNLGTLLRDLHRLTEAEANFQNALDIRKGLADELRTPDARRDLAASYLNLGAVLQGQRRLKEAEPAHVEAVAKYKQLAEDFPDQLQFQRELAASHNSLGALYHETRRPNDAKAAYLAGLAIRKELVDKYPARPEIQDELARSHYNLGTLFQATSRLKEAEAAYGDALALLKQLTGEYPTRPEYRDDLSRNLLNLGNVYVATGRLKEAETAFADALVCFRRLVKDYPNQPERWYRVAGTCGNLALFRMDQKDFTGAKALLDEASSLQEAALKANPQHPEYRRCCLSNLTSLIYANAGLGDEAGAKQAAQKLRDLDWDPPGNAYAAACGLSRCIQIVQKDPQATMPERDRRAAAYGDAAVTMLRDAVARGYRDAAHVEKDSALESLSGRADFQKLLTELKVTK